MGSVFYTKTITQAHGAYRSHYITAKKIKTKTDMFDSKFQVDGDPVDYIEQQFDHDPGLTDRSISRGNALAAIGSFVLDTGYDSGFFRAGVSRINDSIRTYAWAILVSQSQARNSILGCGIIHYCFFLILLMIKKKEIWRQNTDMNLILTDNFANKEVSKAFEPPFGTRTFQVPSIKMKRSR